MTWDELVAGALVGTARRPPVLPPAGGTSPLGRVLAGIDPHDPEGAVLAAGAVLGLYRQAGARPVVDTAPPLPPSPPERHATCSEAAAERLDAILDGRFRAVLPEWLGLAAAAQRIVPGDRLPAVLDAATTTARLRPATAAVVGERGAWLGRLNPTWAWAGGAGDDVDPSAWATGTPPARRLLLERLRARDPAAGRELLASTWATETPEDRASFVALLGANLSMDDEPFLEAALDDRRKEVRHAAAALLARLPDSRLAQRMAERVVRLARVTSIDPSMARDGIDPKGPGGLTEQIVAAAPLRVWREVMDPALAPVAGVVRGWATAAVRQGDEEWALALLERDDVHEPALLGVIPADRAREVAVDRITRLGLVPPVVELLAHLPDPWGPDVSEAVVQRLAEAVKQPRRDPALRAKLTDLGLRLDPSVAPRAAAALAEHAPWWSDVVGWFVDLLTFRAEMREELW